MTKALTDEEVGRPLTDAEVFGTAPSPSLLQRAKSTFFPSAPPRGADGSLPDADAIMRAQNAADPYSLDNTMGRAFTGAVTGIPDLAIALHNAAARSAGYSDSQINPLGPRMMAAGGTAPLPADAPWYRQLGEAGGSALLGGGLQGIAGAAGAAPTAAAMVPAVAKTLAGGVVAPVVGSHYGGQAGGLVGSVLGDRETGALLGSVLGGSAASIPGARESLIDARYRGQGNPLAGQIQAQADRQGVTTTAGMLGNEGIQSRERGYTATRGGGNYTTGARDTAISQIGDAWDRAAAARGSVDPVPTPGTIGGKVADIATTSANDLRSQVSGEQQGLVNQIGPHTPVPIGDIITEARRQYPTEDVPGRAALEYRIVNQLMPLTRDMQGNAIRDANGRLAAPYGLVQKFRSSLGRSFEQGTYASTKQLYDPTTGVMRDVAANAGVPATDFDAIQGRYRTAMHEPDRPPNYPNVPTLEGVGNKGDSAAYNYLHGGLQNPDRLQMLNATGHQRMPEVAGDYLRMLGNNTIGTGGARGPANLATAVERMHPTAQAELAGPQLGPVQDIAGLARAIDYPTSQTGLMRNLGPVVGGSASRPLLAGAIGGMLGKLGTHISGIPGLEHLGQAAGYMTSIPRDYLGARTLQSQAARNAMAGGARPNYGAPDISAVLNAINAATQQAK